MARVINLSPGIPSYRQRVTLEGREYILELRWSGRESKWFLDLRDASGALLAGCIKVVVNWPLLYRFRQVAGMPPGDLVAVDQRAEPRDPSLSELGDAVQLVYLEASEVTT